MVAILDGNYSDSGTAFEIGAYSELKKPIIVINPNGKTINLMIAESLHAVITSFEELKGYDFNELKATPYTDYVW